MVKKRIPCLLLFLLLAISFSPTASEKRDAFVELSADKAGVYVQEQLILTVQLYFSGSLVQGDLTEPEHPNAIIERLGKQQQSARQRDGTRYQMIERRYAVFPQKSGTLELPAIRFEGHVRDSSRRLRQVEASQQLYPVEVKPIPASYPANAPWLPANRLELSENGLPPAGQLEAGSNLTRKVTLQAQGLPAEALPALRQSLPDAIRQYPDRPLRNTETTADGLQGLLQQRFALVPVTAGDITLPALTIAWWNTTTDELAFAELPARQYRITGTEAVVATPIKGKDTDESSKPASTEQNNHTGSGWTWSTLIFAGLWLLTLLLWGYTERRQRKRAGKDGKTPAKADDSTRLPPLYPAGLSDHPQNRP